MKKYLKTVLLTSVVGLCFMQDGNSSQKDEQKEDVQNTTQQFSSLNLSEESMYFENEQDKYEKLKPANQTKPTLGEVVRLVNNLVFIYDKDDNDQSPKSGKYLEVLKKINKIEDTPFSSNCIVSVFSELGCYYNREGQSDLAQAAFNLRKYFLNKMDQ